MKRIILSSKETLTAIRVGLFLAIRQVKRSSKWTTLLITFIMTLTFLNLVVVSGILVGLIEGATVAVRERHLGDIAISRLKEKEYIERSTKIIAAIAASPDVESYTERYLQGATVEANYKTRRRETDLVESTGTVLAGIDLLLEDKATGLSKRIVEGSYLEQGDYDKVLLGCNLLIKYLGFESTSMPALKDVAIGSKVRIKFNNITREMTVKGIIKTKVDDIDRRVYMTDSQLRSMSGRTDYNVGEIAIKIKSTANADEVKRSLVSQGLDQFATIQTFEEGEPKFLKDIKQTFAMLGSMISAIGLVVACITIFIVIFINAITRRKFIGILKGIGIDSVAIEFAYVCQSLLYALVGTLIGFVIVFAVLKPFLDAHPINFPFSDGILVATIPGTFTRAGLLFLATLIAGYIPARMVVKQNTLDAILGR
jgi:putative ABC transport system permease protein